MSDRRKLKRTDPGPKFLAPDTALTRLASLFLSTVGTDSQVDVDAVGDATTLRRTENPTLTNATSVKRQTGRSDLLATLPTELLHLVSSHTLSLLLLAREACL